ncbi:MAG TPA: FxLYD domain-containing protein [Nitrososphaeraceae archaeon]|jgi:hypothetical protein
MRYPVSISNISKSRLTSERVEIVSGISLMVFVSTILMIPPGALGQPGNSTTVPSDIVMLKQQYKSSGGDYDLLQGSIKNIGIKTAKSVTILMNSYDKDGALIRGDAINDTLGNLVPGQKLGFNLSSPKENFEGMYDYTLSLQWLDENGQLQTAEDVSTFPE